MKDFNILYDTLTKAKLIELVLKAEGMDTSNIKKVIEVIEGKLKDPS